MKYAWTRTDAWGKGLAVVLASPLVYFAFGAFCSACLPVSPTAATAVGVVLGFPVWVGAMCASVVARSTVRAWLLPLAVALALAVCTALGLALR